MISTAMARRCASKLALQITICTGQANWRLFPDHARIIPSDFCSGLVSSGWRLVQRYRSNNNPYSNSVSATRIGTSLTYQATLNTGGLLGEYKVVPVIDNSGTPYSCTDRVEFFNVVTGTAPSQPGAINCASMTGTPALPAKPSVNWYLTKHKWAIAVMLLCDPHCVIDITLNRVQEYNKHPSLLVGWKKLDHGFLR